MSGEFLYELYRQACLEVNNCGTDSRYEISDSCREEWNRTAELVVFQMTNI